VLLVVYAGGGLVMGLLLGAAIGLLPAWALASGLRSTPRRPVRTAVTVLWVGVSAIPAATLIVAPEALEPLLLSRGLIAELPVHDHTDEATPKGPVSVQTAHLTAADVPLEMRGAAELRRLGPKDEGWELTVPLTGPSADRVHPGGEVLLAWGGPGLSGRKISAVRRLDDGGLVAVVLLPNKDDARTDDHIEVRIPLGTRTGWLAPPGHAIFTDGLDLHLLEVIPTTPPRPGRGRIRHRPLRVTHLETGRTQIEAIEGDLSAAMTVVVGADDIPEGAEVLLGGDAGPP
jgi:hypothetical protein